MTRWKASALHFCISLTVLAAVVAGVVYCWYPPALFGMARAGQLMTIIFGVDVVLGPLLTLLIYRAGKRGLAFDLTAIALFQAIAMAYGLHVLWQSRPVYIVAISDRFQMVFANEIDRDSQRAAKPQYREAPYWGPEWVSAPLPKDPKQRLEAMLDGFAGKDIFSQPSKFEPYPTRDPEFLGHAIDRKTADRAASTETRTDWSAAYNRYTANGIPPAMMALQSSRGSASVFIDPRDGRILGYAPLDPWALIDAAAHLQGPSNHKP